MKDADYLASACIDPLLIEYPINEHHILYSPHNNSLIVLGEILYKILTALGRKEPLSAIEKEFQIDLQDIIKLYNEKLSPLFYSESGGPIAPNAIKQLDCWLHISSKCNLSCNYCYIGKTNNYAITNFAQADSTIDWLIECCRKRGVEELRIRFAGGEPFLEKELVKQCVRRAEEKKGKIRVIYCIISNGSLISQGDIQWIKDNNIHINISLDGIGETHNKTRRYPSGRGSFEDVYRSITTLIEQKASIAVLTTITESNLHTLPILTENLTSLKNIRFRYSFEKCSGFTSPPPKLITQQKDLISILHNCFSIMENAMRAGNTAFDFSLCDFRIGRPHVRACGAGIKSIALSCHGYGALCGMGLSDGFFVNRAGDCFQEVFDHYRPLANSTIFDKDPCRSCRWRFLCAGGCALNSYYYWGDNVHPSPYCETFSEIIPSLIKFKGARMYYSRYNKGAN